MFRKRAFTLIELLVVIAVIAILMAILMPALKAAKELARGSNCLANQRSLVLAYTMYAGDNDSRIVRGHVDRNNLDSPMWALPPIDPSGAYIAGTPLLEDRIRGIKRGAMYPYINNPQMYHCPGDNRYQTGAPEHLRMYRSYIIPDVLSAARKGFHSWTEARYQYFPKKLDEITPPSYRYIFVESEFQNPNFNYDHGGWSFAPWIDTRWVDALATFHTKSATFGFADGHAEKYKWVHSETWRIFIGDLPIATLQPDAAVNADWRWCWERFPYLHPTERPR
ncbi:MAG: type II secretion system protein [Planctomycetota bacterium]|jgi:prepilin-type N-terminal cleavage/methylation domain-containing protein/prepilin-type processing-associated H-X9-DG protein